MRGILILSAIAVFTLACPGLRAGEDGGDARHGTEQTSTFAWDVDVKYPEMGHAGMDERIREWVNSHVAACLDEVKDFANVGDIDFSWTMSMDYDTTAPSDKAVSLIFTTYTYAKSAAHPMRESNVLNFDTESGKRLSFDDLFDSPDKALAIFAEHAPRLVTEKMKGDYPELFENNGGPDDAFFVEGFEPDRDNYAQIGLEPEGVRVYFQLYQILPYVFGMPEALFTLDMLKEAGPRMAYWGK